MILGGTQCILKIYNFAPGDTGTYMCSASNQYGEAEQTVRVSTADKPQFTRNLEPRATTVGKEVRLEAHVEGMPFPDVKWVKDWHPLCESQRVKLINDGTGRVVCVITDSIGRDAGVYSCIAQNDGGRTTSSAPLTVYGWGTNRQMLMFDICSRLRRQACAEAAATCRLRRVQVGEPADSGEHVAQCG